MQELPHYYFAVADSKPGNPVTLSSPGLTSLESTAPPEFGGPAGNWSPETLLVASVVDCFNLTFHAIARNSKFEWLELSCTAEGILQRVERITRFTQFNLVVTLTVPDLALAEKAEHLLQMAEKSCLITNSMSVQVHLETSIKEAALA